MYRGLLNSAVQSSDSLRRHQHGDNKQAPRVCANTLPETQCHLSLNLINVEQFSHSGSTFGHLETPRLIFEVSITLHSVITDYHVKNPLECL